MRHTRDLSGLGDNRVRNHELRSHYITVYYYFQPAIFCAQNESVNFCIAWHDSRSPKKVDTPADIIFDVVEGAEPGP